MEGWNERASERWIAERRSEREGGTHEGVWKREKERHAERDLACGGKGSPQCGVDQTSYPLSISRWGEVRRGVG